MRKLILTILNLSDNGWLDRALLGRPRGAESRANSRHPPFGLKAGMRCAAVVIGSSNSAPRRLPFSDYPFDAERLK